MTSELWEKILSDFDRNHASELTDGSPVRYAHFGDGASCHSTHFGDSLLCTDLFLLPESKVTPVAQPIDAGIGRAIKARYRTIMLGKLIQRIEAQRDALLRAGSPVPADLAAVIAKKFSVRDALDILQEVLAYFKSHPEIVINCWKRCAMTANCNWPPADTHHLSRLAAAAGVNIHTGGPMPTSIGPAPPSAAYFGTTSSSSSPPPPPPPSPSTPSPSTPSPLFRPPSSLFIPLFC